MTDAWEDPKIIGFVEWLKKQGFSRIRIFINSRKTLRLAVQHQVLKHYEYGSTDMYNVEAMWAGKYCCIYTSSLEEDAGLAHKLKETAGVFQSREIPVSINESRDFRGQRWREINKEVVLESLKMAEHEALACEKAFFVEICEYQQYEETITILDEHMNFLTDDDGDCTFTIRVVAKDRDSVAAVTKLSIVDASEQADFQKRACELARRTAKHARFGLHARRLPSGNYPIVLENGVMAEFTGHYLPMFYGENIRHHTSALAGKERQQVGCTLLRFEEDPFSVSGTCRRRIDDEGMTVSKKTLLRNGVFENILYNKKSAGEAGAESTGNGFKTNITGDIGTGATNVVLSSEGEVFSRKEMIEASEGGIYITRIEGMFAGADPESGNFSLLASGNRIADGRVSNAVHQFTISGNICELWRDIEMIGDDPIYRMTEGACAVSPSVKIKSLMVSGE